MVVLDLHGGVVIGANQLREVAQAFRDHVEDRRVRRERHVLHEPGDARARLAPHRAAVGLQLAAQDLEERGLAGAVAADDGDPLPRLHLQRGSSSSGRCP